MNVATSYYDVRSSCLACTFRWPRVHEERNGSPVMLRRCIFLVSTFENFFLRSHLLPRPFPSYRNRPSRPFLFANRIQSRWQEPTRLNYNILFMLLSSRRNSKNNKIIGRATDFAQKSTRIRYISNSRLVRKRYFLKKVIFRSCKQDFIESWTCCKLSWYTISLSRRTVAQWPIPRPNVFRINRSMVLRED